MKGTFARQNEFDRTDDSAFLTGVEWETHDSPELRAAVENDEQCWSTCHEVREGIVKVSLFGPHGDPLSQWEGPGTFQIEPGEYEDFMNLKGSKFILLTSQLQKVG